MNKEKIRYYSDYNDDFYLQTHFSLPEDYEWVRKDFISRVLSFLAYSAAIVFSNVYCRFFLHVKVSGAKKFKKAGKGGFFLYGNHTQPVGDVFNPALACFPKRVYTLASTANYSLPVIGKILPYLGALPVSGTIKGAKKLNEAIKDRIKRHPIVIFPEAHVWDYYTGIRPFPDTSFKYPVKHNAPVFCMTTTYQKSKFHKKPSITIFIDGPFFAETDSAKENAKILHDKVYDCMQERSSLSNYSFIEYVKREKTENN